MKNENKNSLQQVVGGCLGMILTLFISLWLAGVVIQYGWNNIIAATFEIQRITFWQAVGKVIQKNLGWKSWGKLFTGILFFGF